MRLEKKACIALAAMGLMTAIAGSRGYAADKKKAVRNDPPPYVKPELPAFPGAEGFGAMSKGGRGGRVIKVTNLNADGPGSLAAACAAQGPRIVVFEVSGVIRTGKGKGSSRKIRIKHPNITIAGQTAPGAGITLEGYISDQGIKNMHDIVIRFVRIRPRAPHGNYRTLELNGAQDRVIIDHLSLSWGADDTCSMCGNTNVTAQWTNMEESDIHLEGGDEPHNFGAMFACYGRGNATMHHCLFAHHHERAPLTAADPIDYRNNVLYNIGTGFMTHSKRMNHRQRGKKYDVNLVGNYSKSGPGALVGTRLYMPPYTMTKPRVGPGKSTNAYQGRNFHDWNGGYGDFGKATIAKAYGTPPITTHTAEEAYELVLATGGCLPRDAVSRRTMYEIHTGTGTWGRFEPDAGLMEGMKPGTPRPDGDNDGIPDAWERAHGLNPANPKDANKVVPAGASKGDRHKGYTYIEYYINELADNLVAEALVTYRLADEPIKKDFGPATKLREPLKPVSELVAAIKVQTAADIEKIAVKLGPKKAKYAKTRTEPAWYAIQMLSRMGPAAKDAVPPLVEMLKKASDDKDTRAAVFAAYGLGAIGPAAKDAVPVLIKTLEKDWGVYSGKWKFCPSGWAAWALGRIGPDAKSAVPALGKAMFGKDGWGQRTAPWALAQIGPDAAGALEALTKGLSARSDGREGVKVIHARDAMVNIGKPAVPALVKVIAGGRSAFAAEAAGRLGPLAGPALPGLVKMAAGSDPLARAAALEAICRIDPTAAGAMKALAAGLSDKELRVRHRTARALGEAGPAAKGAVGALTKALSDESLEVRGAAAQALGGIGPAGLAPLVTALDGSKDAWVRLKSARALGRIKPAAEKAVAPLTKALGDPDARVRAEAAMALARIGSAAKSAAAALKKATEDSDYIVRCAAIEALKRTGN